MPVREILLGILAPAVMAGVFFGVSRAFRPVSLAIILGVGGPVLLVFALFIGWPNFPPTDASQRFFYATAACMFIALLHTALKDRRAARPIMPVLFAALVCVPLLILWSQLAFSTQAAGALSTTESWFWVFGAGLAIAALAAGLETLAARAPGAGVSLSWWLVSAGTSAALLISTSAKGTQLAAALAAAMGAAVVAGWIWKTFSLTQGGGRVFAGILGGLVLFGYHFAKLPALSAVLLLSAPLFGWLVELPWFQKRKPWQRALIRMAVCALPLGLAVFLALKANPIEEDAYG